MASQQERAATKELDELLAELPMMHSADAASLAIDLAIPNLEQIEDAAIRAGYFQGVLDGAPTLTFDELNDWVDSYRKKKKLGPRPVYGNETQNLAEDNGGEGSEGSGVTVPLTAKWEPFPVDVLPEPLKTYVPEVANAIGCDPSFIAGPALVALAGAIGNRREVVIQQSWKEPLILWLGIVAPSGTQKSPAMREVVGPLYREDQQALKAYKEVHEGYKTELDNWKTLGDEKSRRDFFPDGKPQEPAPCPRNVVSDITVEALAEVLEYSPGGLLVCRDELGGWLGSFNQYKSGGGSDVEDWLSMYGAAPVTIDRKSTGTILIPRATVSILGTIQPGAARRSLKVRKSNQHIENGLAARILWVMPPTRLRTWTDDDISDATRRTWANLLRNLGELQFADDDYNPVGLTLEPGALDVFKAHFEKCAKQMDELSEMDPMRAAISKLEGGAARIAGLIALGKDPNARSIDESSMRSAVLIAEWFINAASRVYTMLETDDEARERDILIAWIKKHGPCTSRELQIGMRRYKPKGEATMALYRLGTDKLGEFRDRGGKGSGKPGQPTREFVLFGTGQ